MAGVSGALHLYFEGLRYTLRLNVLGIGFLERARRGDLLLFAGATWPGCQGGRVAGAALA